MKILLIKIRGRGLTAILYGVIMKPVVILILISIVFILISMRNITKMHWSQLNSIHIYKELQEFLFFFQLFALLFFLMLFVLGVGSLSALQGVLNTAIRDAFPSVAPWKVSALTATACLLIGLLYVTPVSIKQFKWYTIVYCGG